jgi:hypothetical protein
MAFAVGFGAALLAGNGVAAADTADTASAGPDRASADSGPSPAKVRAKTAGAMGASPLTANALSQTGVDRLHQRTLMPPVRLPAAARTAAAPANQDLPDLGLSASAISAVPAAKAPNPVFNNQTPTLAYNSLENNDVDGQIQGDLHPSDPDSPKLTYTATQPALGSVVINPNGTFAYTPGQDFTGQDMFKVTVSDAGNGFHIHGFAGLINMLSLGLLGTSGHKTTETVFIGQQRTVVASGLTLPVDFRFLPDGRIVVAEKSGSIKMIGTDGTVNPKPVITLGVSTIFERGISGLAVDPQFAANGYIYVAYTTTQIKDRLSRFTVAGDTADPDSEKVLLETADTVSTSHRGGGLAFGPDGKLYWAKGDNNVPANAQDLTNLHGKILRINPDGSTPSDNPVLGDGALPQIYAYGFRNPYRMTFTPTGQLLVADVGDQSFEELNRVTAGGNYGWPGVEGFCTSNCAGLIDPVFAYAHSPGAAFTAVLVRDGSKVVIADEGQKWLKVLTCDSTFSSCGNPTNFDSKAGTTVALGQSPESKDSFYQLTYIPGTLTRIQLTGSSSA